MFFDDSKREPCINSLNSLKKTINNTLNEVPYFIIPERFAYKNGPSNLKQQVYDIACSIKDIVKAINNFCKGVKDADKYVNKTKEVIGWTNYHIDENGMLVFDEKAYNKMSDSEKRIYNQMVDNFVLQHDGTDELVRLRKEGGDEAVRNRAAQLMAGEKKMEGEAKKYGVERWWTNVKKWWETKSAEWNLRDAQRKHEQYPCWFTEDALNIAQQNYDRAKGNWTTPESALLEDKRNNPTIMEYQKTSKMQVGDEDWNKTADKAEQTLTNTGDFIVATAVSTATGGTGGVVLSAGGVLSIGGAAAWTIARTGGAGGKSLDNSRDNPDWDSRYKAANAEANVTAAKQIVKYTSFKVTSVIAKARVGNPEVANTQADLLDNFYSNGNSSLLDRGEISGLNAVEKPINRFLNNDLSKKTIDSAVPNIGYDIYKGVATGQSPTDVANKAAKEVPNAITSKGYGMVVDYANKEMGDALSHTAKDISQTTSKKVVKKGLGKAVGDLLHKYFIDTVKNANPIPKF